jgi:hypothetical protein
MFYQITLFADCLMTLISYMHTHHLVSIHVLPEDTSLNDLLYISQANGLSVLQIRCFTRMVHWLHALLHTSKGTPQFMSMNFKNALLSAWLITHFPLIRLLTTRHVLMYQPALLSEFSTYSIIHHCVCFDVLSDWFVNWIPFYTHHKYKGTQQYIWVDEF